ncbi:MAG: LysE family translocator [Pseudomonadota bacterium]
MLAFASATFLMLITPGPGLLSAAGVGAAFGFRAGLPYVAGLFLGNWLVAVLVISGLWALVETLPVAKFVMGIASLIYFSYIAIKIARANSSIQFKVQARAPGLRDGTALQFINPKCYIFNAFLFLNFPFYPENWPLEMLIKLIICSAIWVPMHLGWMQLGAMIQRLNLGERAQRNINYAMASSLIVVVLMALWTLR